MVQIEGGTCFYPHRFSPLCCFTSAFVGLTFIILFKLTDTRLWGYSCSNQLVLWERWIVKYSKLGSIDMVMMSRSEVRCTLFFRRKNSTFHRTSSMPDRLSSYIKNLDHLTVPISQHMNIVWNLVRSRYTFVFLSLPRARLFSISWQRLAEKESPISFSC